LLFPPTAGTGCIGPLLAVTANLFTLSSDQFRKRLKTSGFVSEDGLSQDRR